MMYAVENTKEKETTMALMTLTNRGTRMLEKEILAVYKGLSNSLKPVAKKKCQLRTDNLTPGSRECIERMREYAEKGLLLESGEVDNTPENEDNDD